MSVNLSAELFEQTQLKELSNSRKSLPNKCVWLDEYLAEKSKNVVQMRTENESLKGRLEDCLPERRVRTISREDRHIQEVTGHKKLAAHHKDSAEQSELRVSYALRHAVPHYELYPNFWDRANQLGYLKVFKFLDNPISSSSSSSSTEPRFPGIDPPFRLEELCSHCCQHFQNTSSDFLWVFVEFVFILHHYCCL